jgi:hypothetical protein
MAIRSDGTAINDTTYTKVGDNVTAFTAIENYVGSIRVVVTDVGDGTPSASEANHIPLDGVFKWQDGAVDIWMISPNGATTVYGAV